jgi:transcriptional regulator of arginine metabolism
MTDGKARRQRAIADLIRSHSIGNQEELAERLAASGFAVTQATVSRDLDELGAVKVRRDGNVAYAMPDEVNPPGWAGRRLPAIIREWVRSIDSAGNLIVIKTPPGSAHLVGLALDQAQLPSVVGTICGDDTIFAAVSDPSAAEAVADQLRSLSD